VSKPESQTNCGSSPLLFLPICDTQPSPGWGFICVECKHTWSDETKYVSFPPSLPCNRVKYDRGGYDRSTYPPTYITPALIFELKRYVDGSESCPSFEAR
jgi:hypothetical protein